MSLAEHLPPVTRGPRCSVGRLPDETLDEAMQLLDAGTEASRVSHALKATGYPIAPQTLHRHLRKQCRCEP